MKTEMDVVIYMYLKDSPDYIDSNYIWVHGSNFQGLSVFTEIPFLVFLALHRERKRCGLVVPSQYYSCPRAKLHIISSFWSVAPCFHSNYFPDF